MNILCTVFYTGLPRASVSYDVRLIMGTCFIILYDEDGERSLTNDAVGVIEDLLLVYPGAKAAVIIYRDSEGCFDFMIPDLFSSEVHFKSIGALSAEGAISWWWRRKESKKLF